ncbi:MAG: corrinoid protein [Dehalococcoidia bacterium]|nr:corrinoid protein [Dehalococcoidia bacterium]
MEELKQLVIDGKSDRAAAMVARLLDEGGSAEVLMEQALIPAMDVVGKLFQDGEYFLPELLVSAKAMQKSVNVIKQRSTTGTVTRSGKAVVGTVKGDLHDIGKNLLIMALEGAGFEVVDLGSDVSTQQFVEAVKEHRPHVMGMSALLSTTMYMMKDVIEAIDREGLHQGVKIMVGGAPLNDNYAKNIGADFYGPDCIAGREYARSIVARKN